MSLKYLNDLRNNIEDVHKMSSIKYEVNLQKEFLFLPFTSLV